MFYSPRKGPTSLPSCVRWLLPPFLYTPQSNALDACRKTVAQRGGVTRKRRPISPIRPTLCRLALKKGRPACGGAALRQNKYDRTWRCALEAGRCAAEGRKRREASALLYFSRRSQCSCPICPRMAMFSWTTAPKVALFLGYPAPAVCFPFSNGAKLLPRAAFPTGQRSIHPQCLPFRLSSSPAWRI